MTEQLRVPPHSIEAERAVLGGAMLDNRLVGELNAICQVSDFYRVAHQEVWQATLDLTRRGEPVDMVTLPNELHARDSLEQVGGIPYLSLLFEQVPSITNVRHYATIVAERAQLRRLITAAYQVISGAYGEPADTQQYVQQALAELTQAAVTSGTGLCVETLPDVIDRLWQNYDDIKAGKKSVLRIPTGIAPVDRVIGGYPVGCLSVLAADAGVGKSSFAVQSAVAVARTEGVHVFVLEDRADQWAARALAQVATVETSRMYTGPLPEWTQEEFERLVRTSADLYSVNRLYFDRLGSFNVDHIVTQMYAMKAKHPEVRLTIIDYVQLLTDQSSRSDKRNYELEQAVRKLKSAAASLDLAILLVSQLNAEPSKREGGEPRLRDLRDTGALGNEARLVIMCHSPAAFGKDQIGVPGGTMKVKSKTKKGGSTVLRIVVNIVKHNHGATGKLLLDFRKKYTVFRELDATDEIGPIEQETT